MTIVRSENTKQELPASYFQQKVRRSAIGADPTVLADIYQDDVNIAIWQRKLPTALQKSVQDFLLANSALKLSISVTPESLLASLQDSLGPKIPIDLCNDISQIVDMFCCLFELQRIGLRLTVLDRPMCPRFHVDRVPCRLVTTYEGCATDWLPHASVNRTKLGMGSNGMPDNKSGLFESTTDIQTLNCAEVALLKGELWENNENAGLVHRSPEVPAGQTRLLLTLDFIE